MTGLNYNHLYYFYRIAVDGGVTAASRNLHLTPQTISGQLAVLEAQVGFPLFERQGKRMVLTVHGRVVFSYAEEIFQIGEKLKVVLKQPDLSERLSVSVGIVDVIPKSLSFELIEPVTELPKPIKLTCREGELDHLLAELALSRLDIVLSDRPVPPGSRLRAFNHPLLETPAGLFASWELVQQYRENFPSSLHGAPFLMPNPQTMLCQLLMTWFEVNDIHPLVVGEFDDSALAKAFAKAGLGFMAAPSVIASDLERRQGLHQLGKLDNVTMEFYAITAHQKIGHPGVKAIVDGAKSSLSTL